MAYQNPQGQYGQLFNGFRIYNEPIQYAASLNGLNFLPDWYTIMSNNHSDSPEDFWIGTPDKAAKYMSQHNINFVIIPEFIGEFTHDKRFQKLNQFTFEIAYHV